MLLCGRRAIAVYSRLRSLKLAYVRSGSPDLAGQAFLVASFFLSFILQFLPYFPILMTKNLPDKEQKKEGLRRRLANNNPYSHDPEAEFHCDDVCLAGSLPRPSPCKLIKLAKVQVMLLQILKVGLSQGNTRTSSYAL